MKPIPIMIAALMGVNTASAVELTDWQLPVTATYGYGTEAGESVQGELELAPSSRFLLAPGTRLELSARARLDEVDRLAPGEPPLETYSPQSRPLALGETGTLELRDAYVEIELDNGIARFGKQQIVWGRLDGLKVLDVLNPQSYREFILEDAGYSRIGLWSGYLDTTLDAWRLELAVIPDATGHEIPDDGAWFQLTAPRFRYGAAPGQPAPPMNTVRDQSLIEETAAGVQVSRFFGSVGVSAMAYSGMDHQPLGRIRIVDSAPLLERYYERRNLLGLSADMAIGSLALRAEAAWQPDRTFNTRSATGLDTIDRDQATLALGADIFAPLDLFVNLQLLVDNVRNAPATLVRPAQDRIATAVVRRSFNYDTVDLEFRMNSSLNTGDRMMSAAATYDYRSNTQLEVRFETFHGTQRGLFGQFEDRDRLLFSLRQFF
jgi:uncharacterized protein DUF1302